ncbi:MAG: DeoR family transcriptional regulator [bacterium]
MSDTKQKFHEFVLQSTLFKGRSDWYFCFLKLERIAHVCTFLADTADTKDIALLADVRDMAAALPKSVLYFAAGEAVLATVLADVFALLFEVRLCAAHGRITNENAALLMQELEMVAEKLHGGGHLSPSLSSNDFAVEGVLSGVSDLFLPHVSQTKAQKDDTSKKLSGIKDTTLEGRTVVKQGDNGRAAKILEYISTNENVSIKDIASFVSDCSEKTIQRELGVLIKQGLIKRVGERRWSQYSLRT